MRVKEAENHGSLNYISSTYDAYDQIIREGFYPQGRKIISFTGVLQQGVFPLPELLQIAQRCGADAMKRPIEIEFACNINDDRTGSLYLLQIRPIVDSKQMLNEDVAAIDDSQCILRSHNSLGHGIIDDITDVVYVKTDDSFTAANNYYVANDIERLNKSFVDENKNYILIGPGRWGSSDHWLGIPVKWPHISAAKLIIETSLANYRIDPSQGTHFFQNLTSFGVGYFTIDENTKTRICSNNKFSTKCLLLRKQKYVRHVRFSQPLRILMDGKRQEGAVLFPETN